MDDSALAIKIEASVFEEDQKKQLIGRLPQMTQDEKGQLLAIIEKAERKLADDVTYQKNLLVINEETEKTMRSAVREETSSARKAFEDYDAEATATKLKVMEEEFGSIPNKPKK